MDETRRCPRIHPPKLRNLATDPFGVPAPRMAMQEERSRHKWMSIDPFWTTNFLFL